MRAAHEAEVRRIHAFVFESRYGWLRKVLTWVVIAAAVLLVATLVVARAKRACR